jgi:sulfite reductase beta subunit-like hemoprotein
VDYPPAPRFPCKSLPEDPGEARLLGIYVQRGEAGYMQRVKVPRGTIRPGQLRALARLAARYTPDYPLHVTTRQDVELHGVEPQDVPAVQHGIAEVGLTTVATCGDSLRNITLCPENGLEAGTWDVADVAASIERFAASLPWIRRLPRKFTVSLSCCPAGCARPWINDLGLAANPDGTFRAVIAGSLGAKPGSGVLLHEALEPAGILPLVAGALKFFFAEGDRRRRTRARLRHVRERLGDEPFRRRIRDLAREEARNMQSPPPRATRVETGVPRRARLALPLGDLAPQDALDLAEAVETAGAELRLGLQHDLLVYGRAPVPLSRRLRGLVDRPTVVACPGSTWCARGIADSRAVARRLLRALPDDCGLSIAIAGCPNNCPQAAVADVGLIGRIKEVDGRRRECFRVLVGGGNGRTPTLASPCDEAVPADQVHRVVCQLVDEIQTHGRAVYSSQET